MGKRFPPRRVITTSALSVSMLSMLSMLACSSSSSSTDAPNDASHDALAEASPSDTFDTGPADVGPACGDPPFVREAVRVADVDDTGREKLYAGAKLSFSTCKDSFATTDSSGEASALVSRGVPFYLRVDAEGHMPLIFGEENVGVDDALAIDKHTGLLPRIPTAAAVPDYGADRPSFAIVVEATGAKQCANPYDAVLTVVGHPEAKAITMNPNWPTDPSPSPASGAGNVVFFTGLAGGQYVEVEGKKPGCILRFEAAGQTGRFYLGNGVLTVGSAFTADP